MKKLTNEQIEEALRRWTAGESQMAIAASLGVTQSAVSRWVRLRTGTATPPGWEGRRFTQRAPYGVVDQHISVEFTPPSPPPRLEEPFELFKGEREAFYKLVGPPSEKGCRLWSGIIDPYGYGKWWTGKRYEKAHRAALRLAYGPIPRGLQGNHKCDVRPCVELEHLWLGTQAENMRDMAAKERARKPRPKARGDSNGHSRLTWPLVREIRRLRNDEGWTIENLALHFGMSPSSIGYIVRNQQWVE